MSDWSAGYNVDLGYTYGYYREMSPQWLDYLAVLRGVAPPRGSCRYLELGCGQGVGLLLMAAQYPEYEFLGIDFHPLHIAHARSLASAAGLTNVRFEEADFTELAQDWPSDWGQFDYVTAHGIFSWIADDVRQSFVECIGAASAPGALVYVSYNTMPGWISTIAVQHLLRLWQTTEKLPSVKAVSEGRDRIKALLETDSKISKILPGIAPRLEAMETQNPSYLVQEYLHDNWKPMWFDQAFGELASAKLEYVGTANIGDYYLPDLLPKSLKEHLNQYDDPIVREVMLDVLINQSFRRDMFARGRAPLWGAERLDTVQSMRFRFVKKPEEGAFKFKISLGEVAGKPEIYQPLLDVLADGPQSLEQLAKLSGEASKGLAKTVQSINMMLHANLVEIDNPPSDPEPAKALNRVMSTKVAAGAPYKYLIGSRTGSVSHYSDVDMIMLAAVTQDPRLATPGPLAKELVSKLLSLGRGLSEGGKSLKSREQMMQKAKQLATSFLNERLPRFKKDGII